MRRAAALLALLCARGAAASAAAQAAAEAALHQIVRDPLALEDSFAALPERLKAHWAASAPHGTVNEVAAELAQPLELRLSVDVRLVGFEGDGGGGARLHAADFAPFLEALRLDVDAAALDGAAAGAMPVRTRFLPSVSSAPRALATQLAAALEAAALATGGDGGNATSPALLPHSVADALVAADFRAAAASRGASYVLYVLNPSPPSSRPYVYSYPGKGQPCGAQVWASRARYAWLDLSAGPAAYGPRSARGARTGGVTPASFPRPAGAFRRGADGALQCPGAAGVAAATSASASGAKGRAELAAALLGVVRAAAAQLLAPPLAHAPVGLWRNTEVALLRVSDVLEDTRPSSENATASSPELSASSAVSGFDAQQLRRELLAAQLGPAGVTVTVRELSFGTCELCGVAFAAALRARAPEAMPQPPAQPRERYVLDAAELHANLAAMLSAMRKEGVVRFEGIVPADEEDKDAAPAPGRSAAFVRGGERRVVPIFLFDLSRTDALLLDGRTTAAAFPDMAVAVRTRAGEAPLPHAWCAVGVAALDDGLGGEGGGVVTAGGRELTRPLLAAALAAGWAVAPPWAPAGGGAGGAGGSEDWTWAAGHTPFGPLAAAEGLPFAARDAAQRHVAIAAAAAARSAAAVALSRFAALPGAADALPRAAATEVAGRAGALRHKLRRAVAALGAHQFDIASYYARSAAHDAAGIESALERAAADMPVRLDCSGGDGTGSSAVRAAAAAAASAVACGAAGWALRRAKDATQRRKQW